MKRKQLFLTLGCATLMAASLMTGCGDKKEDNKPSTETTTNETTESTAPSTESTQPTESTEVATGDFNIKDYVTESIEDGKLVIKAKNDEYVWQQYDDGFVEVTVEEDAPYITYTVKGTEASPTVINLIGDFGGNRISYLFNITVNDDLTIAADYVVDASIIDVGEEEDVPMQQVDIDLDMMSQNVLGQLGEENLPGFVETRMLDLDNADEMMFNLGVDKLSGLSGAAISESMMTSTAFELVTLRFDDNASAEAAATKLKETAPVQKWVCVIPDEVKTKVVNDTYVIFIMCSKDAADIFDKITF